MTWAPRLGRPLGQYQTHPAGPGVQQHRVAGLHGIHRLDQQVGGHALEDRRRGDVGGHRIRHRRNDIGWRDTVFGVGADGVGGRDPVTHTQRGHALTHRCHGAGHFGAEDERQFMRIQPRPEIGVDEIHADRLGLDQHLAGPGEGCGLSTRERTSGPPVCSTSIACMFKHSNATSGRCRWIP